MVVVALDTSHAEGSAAAARDGALLGVTRFGGQSSHLSGVGPSLERLLAASGTAPAEIDRIAIVIGPGSFTGLRIGLAFVKGLSAGGGIEVVTVGTLELIALAFLEGHETVCPMIDAHRGEVYAAVYRASALGGGEGPLARAQEVVAPCAAAPETFLARLEGAGVVPSLFAGTGVAPHGDLLGRFPRAEKVVDPARAHPSTEHLARIAHRLDPLEPEEVRDLEPLYLRESSARPRRLRPIDP